MALTIAQIRPASASAQKQQALQRAADRRLKRRVYWQQKKKLGKPKPKQER